MLEVGWQRARFGVPRSPSSTGSEECAISWFFLFTTAGLSSAGSLPLSAALPVVETHWDADGDVAAKWDGTASYSHWKGRLLDEAESTGLRRRAKEKMDKFYRQSVARCCREVGCFCSDLSRGEAHATLQAPSSREGRVKSGCGRGTDATRFLAEFLDGLVKVLRESKEKSGGGWRRLPQKVEARGRSNNCRQQPHPAMASASPTAKRSQLDDWSDSPKLLTKGSAAPAPLPALARTSLGPRPPSAHQPWESISMGPGVLAPAALAH